MSIYFEKFLEIIQKKALTDRDEWNMHETDFWIYCKKAQLVITIDQNKPLQ